MDNETVANTESPEESKPLKIVVVGDPCVGKTCMLITYIRKQFPTDYVPTVCDNYSGKIVLQGQTYLVCLWDTAGQESYENIRTLSYSDTNCYILCYSVENHVSFTNISDNWIKELRSHSPKTPIILVGTKLDLRNDGRRCVSLEEAKKLRSKIGAFSYLECSAMKNEGLNDVFHDAVFAASKKPSKRSCLLL